VTAVATMPQRAQQETTGEIIKRFQQQAPVDVMGIAESLGLRVWEDDINPYSGKITRDPIHGGPSGYSVIVNAIEPTNRKRFTIAHEVAHFILHSDELLKGDIAETLYRGGLSDNMEAEANQLAADILMPIPLIEKLIAQGFRSIEELADKLEVSKTAIGIRLGAPYAD
jgi:Zn-dependent peptidase ImmA (M78 family)